MQTTFQRCALWLRPALVTAPAVRIQCNLWRPISPPASMMGMQKRLNAQRAGMPSSLELPTFVDHTLRGFGQVVFCNSATSGALIASGLCYGDLTLAALAVGGCTSATATAKVAGLDAGAISTGLMGYNGALVGCAFSVFLGTPGIEPMIAATVVGGAASAFVTSWLGKMITSVPQWTLAFNATALAALVYARPFANATPAEPVALSTLSPLDWCSSVFTGISQIFVVNNPIAGALVLAGIAAYSPGAAAAALCGSLLGVVSAAVAGADAEEVKAGLWGFNPALTALAVSIFYVPLGGTVLCLACGGAVATAFFAIGMKGAFATMLQVPALTLPFCAVASACHLLAGKAPGLVLAARPHSPEENLRAFKAAAPSVKA